MGIGKIGSSAMEAIARQPEASGDIRMNTTLVLFSSLDRMLENVEYVVMNYRPVLNGEHYLTGEEVCERLCISKRTLQDYRDTGLLGYVQLPGKIIYRESEIERLLEDYYINKRLLK